MTYASSPATSKTRVTLRRDGDRVVIVDDDTRALVASRPMSVTDRVVVRGIDGNHNDALTVDLRGGLSIPGGVDFDAGVAGFDTLTIVHDGAQLVRFDYEADDARGHRGRVVIDGTVINYHGIEPLTNTGTAADIVFNLPPGTLSATLQDDGVPNNGLVQLVSLAFEATTFSVPTSSLTIDPSAAVSDTDTITVSSNFSGDFNESLIINGKPASDVVTLNALTLGNGGANTGVLAVTANTIIRTRRTTAPPRMPQSPPRPILRYR